jgi:hypothetical protein
MFVVVEVVPPMVYFNIRCTFKVELSLRKSVIYRLNKKLIKFQTWC